MGIFGSLFRNKVGMQSKSESLNNHISIYQKIIDDKNTMEKKALDDLQNMPSWQMLFARKSQIDFEISQGKVSADEWSKISSEIESLKHEMMSQYIDGQDEGTIYGILRNGLKVIKTENINLPNMNEMKFDFWVQIEESAELAQISILQIQSSDTYMDAIKNDKLIRDYQVRRHFRK